MHLFCPLKRLIPLAKTGKIRLKIGVFWLVGALVAFCQTVDAVQDTPVPDGETIQRSFQRLGKIRDDELTESSGLAISSIKNAYWTINDSGNLPALFLMNRDGQVIAKHPVAFENRDWEALGHVTIDKRIWLVVGDVGDNLLRRKQLQLYVLPEPPQPKRPGDAPLKARCLQLTIGADGTKPADLRLFQKQNPKVDWAVGTRPANIEAIGIDPTTRDIWLVEKVYLDSKQITPPGIFIARLPKDTFDLDRLKSRPTQSGTREKDSVKATRVADFPIKNVTGMAFSPSGNRMIIRNYLTAHLYRRQAKEDWVSAVKHTQPQRVLLPLQRQGEAICFASDDKSVILTSEIKSQPVWKVDLDWYLDQPIRTKQNRKAK